MRPIKHIQDYTPDIGKLVLNEIETKVKSMAKFNSTTTYMFTIKGSKALSNPHALQLAKKYANRNGLKLDTTTSYVLWANGQETYNLGLTLHK